MLDLKNENIIYPTRSTVLVIIASEKRLKKLEELM